MEVTIIPGFQDIDAVEFATDSSLTSALTAVLFDNIAYDVYIKQGSSY
jgi:hypothetical protein